MDIMWLRSLRIIDRALLLRCLKNHFSQPLGIGVGLELPYERSPWRSLIDRRIGHWNRLSAVLAQISEMEDDVSQGFCWGIWSVW